MRKQEVLNQVEPVIHEIGEQYRTLPFAVI